MPKNKYTVYVLLELHIKASDPLDARMQAFDVMKELEKRQKCDYKLCEVTETKKSK